ncbi:hypothetical protein BG004_008041 [Podila humilis]|nr:hypothetical protein BG004_008041 [Podila humilis]
MLTYTRRHTSQQVEPLSPPIETLDLVLQENALFDMELSRYSEYQGNLQLKFDAAREEERALYSCWNVDNDTEPSYYVPAESLAKLVSMTAEKSGVRAADPLTTQNSGTTVSQCKIDAAGLSCKHQKLCPVAVAKSKRISQAAKHVLDAQGVTLSPLLTPMDTCADCVRAHVQDKLYGIQHRRDIDEFEKRNKGKSAPIAWISKAWLNDWLRVSPQLHIPHCAHTDDPSPLSHPFANDVLCKHFKLSGDKTKRKIINKNSLEVLSKIFGPLELPGPNEQECSRCLDDLQPHLNDQKDVITRATSEKVELAALAMRSGRLPRLVDMERYYVLADDFLDHWLEYVKRPLQKERPTFIDNSGLLCGHGGFLFDANDIADAENADDFSVITSDEWAYLFALYGGGPVISVARDRQMPSENTSHDAILRWSSYPAVCQDCRDKRVLDFASAPLHIRIYSPDDAAVIENDTTPRAISKTDSEVNRSAVTAGSSQPASGKSNASNKRKKTAPKSESLGTRRSKRSKPEANANAFKEIVVHVSKDDTVMSLKRKIMQKTRIVPIYQKLLYGGKELDDNDKTMADLEIVPKSVLIMIAFDQSMESVHLDMLEDFIPAPGDVGGFGGTGLVDDEEWASYSAGSYM